MAIAAALVGAWFLHDFVYLRAQNHPWLVGVCVVLAVGGAWLFYQWQEREIKASRDRVWRDEGAYVWSDDPRVVKPSRAWVPPVAILVVVSIWGVTSGITARNGYVDTYCRYGAKSAAQLEQCKNHVNTDYINGLDTHAAKFARGDTSECLADAGPFCEAAARYNTVDYEDTQ